MVVETVYMRDLFNSRRKIPACYLLSFAAKKKHSGPIMNLKVTLMSEIFLIETLYEKNRNNYDSHWFQDINVDLINYSPLKEG
jgi:hypothetical protein